MANLLRVNGIIAPVLIGSATHTPKAFAENVRAEDMSLLIHRRRIIETYKATIGFQVPSDAIAWRRLLMGEGHYWSFDDSVKWAYSSKGLGPTGAIVGVTQGTSSPAPYLGAGRISIAAAGTPNTLTFVIGPCPQGMTVMVARNPASAGWAHVVKDSTGNVWSGGVLIGSAAWITMTPSTGTVVISGDASLAEAFDELVILPFVVPSSWPAQMFAWNNGGSQFSALGRLTVDGDLIDASQVTKTVAGRVGDIGLTSGTLNGTYYQDIRSLTVELEEV